MRKDKLITVRINKDLQTKFNQWLAVNRISGSEFLRKVIEGCVNDTLTLDDLNLNTSIDKLYSIDTERLKKLETRLEELESNLSSLVSSQIDSQLALLKQSILDELVVYSQSSHNLDSDSQSSHNLDSDSQSSHNLDSIDSDSQSSHNLDSIDNDRLLADKNQLSLELTNDDTEKSKSLTVNKVEDMPTENELEIAENEEGIITPEKENKGIRSENKKAKLKPLPQEFLDLPTGTHTATLLAKILGFKTGSSLTRFAKKTSDPPFKDFWLYLSVSLNEKNKFVWTKIK